MCGLQTHTKSRQAQGPDLQVEPGRLVNAGPCLSPHSPPCPHHKLQHAPPAPTCIHEPGRLIHTGSIVVGTAQVVGLDAAGIALTHSHLEPDARMGQERAKS